MNFTLWILWFQVVSELRGAFSRNRTFYWALSLLAGFSIRQDLYGVTSLIRSLGLKRSSYQRVLDFFHSPAIKIDLLAKIWLRTLLKFCTPCAPENYLVFIADGIKVGKEGKKMPAVKSQYQSSGNNSKPEYIMGHSLQTLSLLVENNRAAVAAIPIVSRIHEGLCFSNRDQRSLLDKLADMIKNTCKDIGKKGILVADAYYGSADFSESLEAQDFTLITRLKHNAVAYHPAPLEKSPRRGRKKKYGKKIKLWSLFNEKQHFIPIPSPIVGEEKTTISYCCIDLIWRGLGRQVRFVLVDHPKRGKMILLVTDQSLNPVVCIKLYAHRFRIEVTFRQLVHTLGGFSYKFWMKAMTPIKKGEGTQYPHRESPEYRKKLRSKMHAYHTHINLAGIAQGAMQYLSLYHSENVWDSFNGWLRTIRPEVAPSEFVVANALRATFPGFLQSRKIGADFKKFMEARFEPERTGWKEVA